MPSLHLIVASGTAQRRVLEETIEAFKKKGYVLSGRQEGGEWVPLISENMSGGLFNENRLVVVDSAELLGSMPENLSGMVVPDAAVVILLVYDAEPTKLIPKEIFKKCAVVRAKEFPRWPRERRTWVANTAKEMGLIVDRDAVDLIVELLGDPEEIRAQLISLSIYRKNIPVKASDVEDICLDDGSGALFKLLDALCNGDAAAAIKNLRIISGRGELFPLITALHNRLRLALYAAEYQRDGMRFARALGARDYAWRQAGNAARRYGAEALADFVVGLITLNMEEKSGRGSGWFRLELLILNLLEPAGQWGS